MIQRQGWARNGTTLTIHNRKKNKWKNKQTHHQINKQKHHQTTKAPTILNIALGGFLGEWFSFSYGN